MSIARLDDASDDIHRSLIRPDDSVTSQGMAR